MKKFFASCSCLILLLSLSGCSPGAVIDRFVSTEDSSVQETVQDKPRVYMDEIRGILQDFTGSQVTILSDKTLYTFDVSQASL